MLKELQITGFALIEKLQLSFYSGFNVLTGETGAGKSIIVDALSLLLGARASSEMIRTGTECATVEGVFDSPKSAILLLEQWGIEVEEDLVVAREIHLGGRNKCWINGRLATVNQLLVLGRHLVDILGQNDNQNLLDNTRHLEILDQYGDKKHQALVESVAEHFKRYQKVKQKRVKLQEQERERLSRIDLLQFQVKEIDDARIKDGEKAELVGKRDKLANMEKLTSTAEAAYACLQGEYDSQQAVYDSLAKVVNDLTGLLQYDENLTPIVTMLNESLVQIEEGARELRYYLEGFELDPRELTSIEDRLQLIRTMERKYGDSEATILDYCEASKKELTELLDSEQTIESLNQQESEMLTVLTSLTNKLTSSRKRHALILEEELETQLADLNMEKTQFMVDITPTELNINGVDQVEFKISPNLGEDLKPLTKIASGGELSRIMLALKSSLAKADSVPTLVFDEVDSGIGGRTAQKIAAKIQQLSKNFQVFTITHLPVVASFGKNHYLIEKQRLADRTVTVVKLLNYEERVAELARMLGGQGNQEITAAHAKELLKQANTS